MLEKKKQKRLLMARQMRLIIGKKIAMMILQLITEKSEIGNAETLFVAKCGITGE